MRYIELSKSSREGDAPSAVPMDAELAALGLPQVGNRGADGTTEIGANGSAPDYFLFDPVLWTGDNAQLEDWLYTNHAASMELLEGAGMTLT